MGRPRSEKSDRDLDPPLQQKSVKSSLNGAVRGKRQKLSDVIVEEVQRWIVVEGKQPTTTCPTRKSW
jgi:hypothetical protein